MLPGNCNSVAQGGSISYSYLLYSPGRRIHHTVTRPLEDGRVYYCQCGGGSPELQFKSPSSKFPVTFAVAGDLGQNGWTKSTLEHTDQRKCDMHLLHGDLSYSDFIQHRWDTFGELTQLLASTSPRMVTQGSPEKEHIPLIKERFASYNTSWEMPYASTSDLYYSVQVAAGAHLIMLRPYTDYDEYLNRYNWPKLV